MPEGDTGVCWSAGAAIPTWPSPLAPQHQSVLSFFSPQVCAPPAETSVQVVNAPLTSVGEVRCVTVPSPSRPPSFRPQQYRRDAVDTAQVCASPALTRLQIAAPICTGVVRLSRLASPSCPLLL
jgi:hypothetical protein